MRILLFGGSFNPVHLGHLLMAEEVREEFAFDRVIFIPALRSPFKDDGEDPGPEARLEMLRIACRDNPHFSVDDRELRRGGISYTIDTLRELRQDLMQGGWIAPDESPGSARRPGPSSRFGLLIGDDLLAGFDSWREHEALAREARIIVGRRKPMAEEASARESDHDFESASNRIIPISSSEIRQRCAAGRSLRYLLPEGVIEYILRRHLYGSR